MGHAYGLQAATVNSSQCLVFSLHEEASYGKHPCLLRPENIHLNIHLNILSSVFRRIQSQVWSGPRRIFRVGDCVICALLVEYHMQRFGYIGSLIVDVLSLRVC
jgi:hypothetical protein